MNNQELINYIKKQVRHELSKINFQKTINNELKKFNIEALIKKIVKEELLKIMSDSKEKTNDKNSTEEQSNIEEENLNNL